MTSDLSSKDDSLPNKPGESSERDCNANKVDDSPDNKIQGVSTVPKTTRAESSNSAQDESTKSAQVESTKSAQVESTKSAQIESSKSAQVESTESAQVESTESAQVESTESAQVESSKSAQMESSKSAQMESSKSAQVESSKSRISAKPDPNDRGFWSVLSRYFFQKGLILRCPPMSQTFSFMPCEATLLMLKPCAPPDRRREEEEEVATGGITGRQALTCVGVMVLTSSEARLRSSVVLPALSRPSNTMRSSCS
ncbi:hypothetical protein CRUP_030054, partial [Coryphaenoides rupestris]